MSILSGYGKFKRYLLTDDGYKLLSQWTSSNSVHFDDDKTAETKVGAIDGITDSLTSTNSRIALSAKSGKDLQDQVTSLNTDFAKAITTDNIGQQSVNYAGSAGYATSAGSAVDQTARNAANNLLPASIGEYGVSTTLSFTGSFITFSTIPFPYADKYNINFRMTGINNRSCNFGKDRFVVSRVTRSGIDLYTDNGDVIYWTNSNKGDATSVGFAISGTLK